MPVQDRTPVPFGTRLKRRAAQARRQLGTRARRVVAALRGRELDVPKKPVTYQNGMVEEFTRKHLVGWVAVKPNTPPVRITLHINGVEVAKTNTADTAKLNNWGEIRPFRIALKDVWQFCRKTDHVSVRADGHNLPIYKQGMYHSPQYDGKRSLEELQAKLEGGYLFAQKGTLQLSRLLDTEWQRDVIALYQRVRKIVADRHGYDAFLIYGTLLGKVRENGFIGHDPDFDCAYISAHADPQAAARELQELGFDLIADGLHVDCMRTSLHISDPTRNDTRIDLFHLYFDDTGLLRFPFGVAGTTTVSKQDWRGAEEVDFAGSRVLAPVNREAVVEHIYGASWRVPKTGFNWDRDRTTRDWKGILPLDWGQQVYWENFYAHSSPLGASDFAVSVSDRADVPHTVIDLGCGDGRDAVAFARSGHRVVGLDRSPTGVQHATAAAAAAGVSDAAQFAVCEFTGVDALRSALTAARAGDEPVLFYLRFLLHVLTEEGQDGVLATIAECARPGDLFAAELRTDKDQALPKQLRSPHRRFQPGPPVGAALHEKFGFSVLDEAEGTGLSVFGKEDPELYRVVARRD